MGKDVRISSAQAMRLLWPAFRKAVAGTDPWQEAVPVAELREMGVRRADLRRLVRAGIVEYRVETTTARSKRRRFQVWHNLAIPDRSCFILTKRGIAAARFAESLPTPKPDKPRWDGAHLWWGDEIIKTPVKQAKSQHLILAECERRGWHNPIDLRALIPANLDRNHWAVNMSRNLNHGLKRIRFHADGSKHGITWERVE